MRFIILLLFFLSQNIFSQVNKPSVSSTIELIEKTNNRRNEVQNLINNLSIPDLNDLSVSIDTIDNQIVEVMEVLEDESDKGGRITKFEADGKIILVITISFSTGKSVISDKSKRVLYSAYKKYYLGKENLISRVHFWGHSDLESIRSDSNFEYNDYCADKNIAMGSHQCLGIVRAEKVRRFFENKFNSLGNREFESPFYEANVEFHNHPFLELCDRRLNGKLFNLLEIEASKEALYDSLNIRSNLSPQYINMIRNNKDIKKKIKESKQQYRKSFKDYRSVVVVNYMK